MGIGNKISGREITPVPILSLLDYNINKYILYGT